MAAFRDFAGWTDLVGVVLATVVLGALIALDLLREAGRRVPPLIVGAVALLGVLLVALIGIRFVRRVG